MFQNWLAEEGISIVRKAFDKLYISRKRKRGPGSDQKEFDRYLDESFFRLEADIIFRKLMSNNNSQYFFSPFLETIIQEVKPNGQIKKRPIVQSTIRDALAQQIILDYLNSYIGNQFFYTHSYAYQTKKSPLKAAKEVKNALKLGYIWAYDADLANFFGSINHKILLDKIQKYFPGDEVLKTLVNRLIKTGSIRVENFSSDYILQFLKNKNIRHLSKKTNKHIGIPQGAILSGFLANLFLHDFDLFLQNTEEIKYIRYADDFVVLTKELEHCIAIGKLISNELQEKFKVKINIDKTSTRCERNTQALPEDKIGFEFIGFRFKNNIISAKSSAIDKFVKRLKTIIVRTKIGNNKYHYAYYSIASKGFAEILYPKQRPKGILLSNKQLKHSERFTFYLERLHWFLTSDKAAEEKWKHNCWTDYFHLINDQKQINYLNYMVYKTIKHFFILLYPYKRNCPNNLFKTYPFTSFKNKFYRKIKANQSRNQR